MSLPTPIADSILLWAFRLKRVILGGRGARGLRAVSTRDLSEEDGGRPEKWSDSTVAAVGVPSGLSPYNMCTLSPAGLQLGQRRRVGPVRARVVNAKIFF